jgi:hypothetical protein
MADDGPFSDLDPAAEVAENNARRDEKRREREDAETLRVLLKHKNGRAWFFRLLTRCHIYGTPFEPGQPDTTAFKLGEENIGRKLMYDALDACPDLYLTMRAEARQAEEAAAAAEADAEKKAEPEYNAGVQKQGFELPPPPGWPGHVPPVKPEGK